MKETKIEVYGSGFKLATLLGVAFIILKLIGEIAWPWIWVLAPIWIPWAFVIFLFILILCYAFISSLFYH